ncbi:MULTISPECIES: hypoxanthine phosphoribosyltransferase [unclassified Aureispira]|uniref:hypoxanthine phosphoribosyltransferase n=1 Tax=unclassified Aureispira TaxID=2649989 RepID=UPI00069609F2|nr:MULTISPECIES: hypoxanthine phosphoribosyltransferase [unclassified Aureispira]WMX17428.1 hypoxanthine phosphoribosyltransferase [Aureispira sp. CCB-E]
MITCKDKQFELFLTSDAIQTRLKEICAAINVDYVDKKPVFLGILNGVFRLAGDVFNYVDIECEVSFVKLKSYVGTQSSGALTTMLGLDVDLKGRHVILMEDIVDTGRTLHNFLPELEKMNPASIAVLTLLNKPDAMEHDIPMKYIGFKVPNNFLIGYGLDYDGWGRHHNDIYTIVQ